MNEFPCIAEDTRVDSRALEKKILRELFLSLPMSARESVFMDCLNDAKPTR